MALPAPGDRRPAPAGRGQPGGQRALPGVAGGGGGDDAAGRADGGGVPAGALARPAGAGLEPLAEADAALLAAVNGGEFAINGFRNRDVRQRLYGERPADPAQARRQAAKVTRQLRLLRAHGLIRKVPKTHRYVLSEAGRPTITAILAARQADSAALTAVP
jgi:hypothetical protein